jgi:hypothetical protein
MVNPELTFYIEFIKKYREYIFKKVKINTEFYSDGDKWRCTDKGSRTIVAIKLDKSDPNWYIGPPYPVKEWVFDEDDMTSIYLNETETINYRGNKC